MDAMIPLDVLEQLRARADEGPNTDGWFTSWQLREELGWGIQKTRHMLRKLMVEGKLEVETFGIPDAVAVKMGLLGGSGVKMYRLIPESEAA